MVEQITQGTKPEANNAELIKNIRDTAIKGVGSSNKERILGKIPKDIAARVLQGPQYSLIQAILDNESRKLLHIDPLRTDIKKPEVLTREVIQFFREQVKIDPDDLNYAWDNLISQCLNTKMLSLLDNSEKKPIIHDKDMTSKERVLISKKNIIEPTTEAQRLHEENVYLKEQLKAMQTLYTKQHELVIELTINVSKLVDTISKTTTGRAQPIELAGQTEKLLVPPYKKKTDFLSQKEKFLQERSKTREAKAAEVLKLESAAQERENRRILKGDIQQNLANVKENLSALKDELEVVGKFGFLPDSGRRTPSLRQTISQLTAEKQEFIDQIQRFEGEESRMDLIELQKQGPPSSLNRKLIPGGTRGQQRINEASALQRKTTTTNQGVLLQEPITEDQVPGEFPNIPKEDVGVNLDTSGGKEGTSGIMIPEIVPEATPVTERNGQSFKDLTAEERAKEVKTKILAIIGKDAYENNQDVKQAIERILEGISKNNVLFKELDDKQRVVELIESIKDEDKRVKLVSFFCSPELGEKKIHYLIYLLSDTEAPKLPFEDGKRYELVKGIFDRHDAVDLSSRELAFKWLLRDGMLKFKILKKEEYQTYTKELGDIFIDELSKYIFQEDLTTYNLQNYKDYVDSLCQAGYKDRLLEDKSLTDRLTELGITLPESEFSTALPGKTDTTGEKKGLFSRFLRNPFSRGAK